VLAPRAVVLTGRRASMDVLGRLVYAARRGPHRVEVFEYRTALSDTGASTVPPLGDSPLSARDRLLEALTGPMPERAAVVAMRPRVVRSA
jgi:hypothetical protein